MGVPGTTIAKWLDMATVQLDASDRVLSRLPRRPRLRPPRFTALTRSTEAADRLRQPSDTCSPIMTDHEVIRRWAARHSAEPATGEATASGPGTITINDGGAGIRFNFPAQRAPPHNLGRVV
jgi:hypothetical protein